MRITLHCSAALALSACAGAATAQAPSGPNTFPASIASHHEMMTRHIASRLFTQLPGEHQAKIADAGGIGSEGFVARPSERGESPLADMTAAEYLEVLVTDELAQRLSEQQWHILRSIAETIDAGDPVPHLCFSPDTDPAYAYAVNELIELPLRLRFQQTSRWSSTAVDGGGLSQGDPTTLTYSFVPDGTDVPNLGIGVGSGDSALFAWLDGVYGGNTQAWQDIFHQVFDRWEELIGTTYIFEPNDDGVATNSFPGVVGVRGDVRIAAFNFQNDGNGGILAYNNFPNDGDMVFDAFDTFYNNTGGNSIRLRNVTAHEHGHGLGMLHVCPVTESKLMEPFVSVSFDGPQLDDILNGIRHYGDIYEPNGTIGQATDLGTLGFGGAANVQNAGVDDNSDSDYFKISVDQRSRITFAVQPDAAAYEQGSQTSQCNSGFFTDYREIQDLQVTVVDGSGNFLASVDDTGLGGGETMVFDAEVAGDYFFVVNGATSVNNVQRYFASAFVTQVPFLVPTIDADPPEAVDPGVATTFDVTIDPREDTIVPGSAELLVSINGGSFQATDLTHTSGDDYTATLPAVGCDDTLDFYVSVEGQTGGEITLPEDGASDPFVAAVGQFVNTFEDNFETDMGWTVTGNVSGATEGEWERAEPSGNGDRGDPTTDADGSGMAFLTGDELPNNDNTDVDGGQTILNSPALELDGSNGAVISYSRWYDNTGSGTGASPGADVFTVQVSNNNGSTWTTVEVVGPSTPQSSGGWFDASFRVADFVTPTDQIRVRFIAEDAGDGSVIEAGVDAFTVTQLACEDPDTCAADFSGDGTLNFFDVSAFLSAFNSGDLAADITGDGFLNFFDVSAFLTAFNAGCS